jgi:GTP cyclohydrolase I
MIDEARIKKAVREILEAIGEDADREGLRDTPARVARMYAELLAGQAEDPNVHLKAVFDEQHHEIVLIRDIAFHSTCEHHMMPFDGVAHVAYIPDGKVLGISKFARIVDAFARRLQVQERLTSQIADFINSGLHAKGVAVVIEAAHSCMTARGVRKPGSAVVTSALRGLVLKNQSTRDEVMSLIHGPRRVE